MTKPEKSAGHTVTLTDRELALLDQMSSDLLSGWIANHSASASRNRDRYERLVHAIVQKTKGAK